MRFVLSIVLFAVALVATGLGIAQRTVWAPPEEITLEVETQSPAPLTVIGGDVLNAHEGRQTISIQGEGTVTAAYGRTTDVLAWIGEASHNRIGHDPETGELTSQVVRGTELEVPPLQGSDLWLNDYTQENRLSFTTDVPEDVSVIIAAGGTAPAPSLVSVTWPVDNTMPWSTPLIVGGLIALIAGLGALIWALYHYRRSRGPRRKQPRMPKPPRPRPRPYRATRRAAGSPRRGSIGRPFAVIAAAVAASLAFGAPALAESPAANPVGHGNGSVPAAAQTEAETEVVLPPTAVTEPQLARIVRRIGQTIAEADENRDAELAATRLDGPALEFRKASYKIREADDDLGHLPVIPSGPVQLSLPQQLTENGATWPRVVFTVVQEEQPEPAVEDGEEAQEDEDVPPPVPPVALVLIQQDPRSQYQVHYAITLHETLPEVAPPAIGAARLPLDSKFLTVRPDELATAYADVLLKGEESEYAELFAFDRDALLPQIGPENKQERRKKLPSTASIKFSNEPGTGAPIALSTNDAGALVSISINEIDTVKPVENGAAVNPEGAVKALSGKKQTTKGIKATWGNQLLFYVPPATDDTAQVVLLGYNTSLIAASEL